MFNDARVSKQPIRRLKISRKLLRIAALFAALLLPLGIMALRPSQADDHAASTVPPASRAERSRRKPTRAGDFAIAAATNPQGAERRRFDLNQR